MNCIEKRMPSWLFYEWQAIKNNPGSRTRFLAMGLSILAIGLSLWSLCRSR